MFKIIFAGLLFSSLIVSAQLATDLNSSDEELLEDIAKNRLYPGGIDEQALQVQESLPYPVSSINLIAVQESVLNEEDDNDNESSSSSHP